jgi:branched-subunit amino acid aminotransferase/4-amino-4-deoxychorismate lyase
MSESAIYRWQGDELHPLDHVDLAGSSVAVADSWLVTDGETLALDLHRERFLRGAARVHQPGLDAFWTAAIAAIPREGDWFPRTEVQVRHGAPFAVFRLRPAPERSRSVRVASHLGPDPRSQPTIKGPGTAALLLARTLAKDRGADEAVILSPERFVVEGAYSAFLWWRGDVLCAPSPELERVDSVTARSVIALATALGVQVYYESVTPAELDGCEIWSVSALHGIRIVTAWIDGPNPAEQPGRLSLWRARLDRLRRPLPPA